MPIRLPSDALGQVSMKICENSSLITLFIFRKVLRVLQQLTKRNPTQWKCRTHRRSSLALTKVASFMQTTWATAPMCSNSTHRLMWWCSSRKSLASLLSRGKETQSNNSYPFYSTPYLWITVLKFQYTIIICISLWSFYVGTISNVEHFFWINTTWRKMVRCLVCHKWSWVSLRTSWRKASSLSPGRARY